MTRLRPLLVRAALFLAASLGLVLVGYLAINVPGAWFPSAAPQTLRRCADGRIPGACAGHARCAAGLDRQRRRPAVVVLKAALRSSDFAGIEWIVAGLPDDADVRLMWRTNYQPERLNLAAMTVDGGRLRPIVIRAEPAWIGTIVDLGLAVRGNPQAPFEVRGVIARPLGAVELRAKPRRRVAHLRGLARDQRRYAGRRRGRAGPAATRRARAGRCCLSSAATRSCGASRRTRVPTRGRSSRSRSLPWRGGSPTCATAGTPRASRSSTARTYGGTDWREAHLAAEDAALFKLVRDAKREACPTRNRACSCLPKRPTSARGRLLLLSAQSLVRCLPEHGALARS